MNAGVQIVLAELGEAACYALTEIKAARPGLTEGEAVDLILRGIEAGHIYYNRKNRADPQNCYVSRPAEFLSMIMGDGSRWDVRHQDLPYKPKPGELWWEKWEYRPNVRTNLTHFRLPDWDPYPGSETVRLGRLVQYRVARRV